MQDEANNNPMRDAPTDNNDQQAVTDPRSWRNWPRCPECTTHRSARCGVCGSIGVSFRLASVDTDEPPSRVLLMCPTCDDHFRPEFERYCQRCSHDFDDGFETDAENGSTDRAMILIAGLLAVCLALGGYFWWLLRS
jgi:hypothetical protein